MKKYDARITLSNSIEADLLSKMLEEKNIPHVVISYHDTAYDGLFQMQQGWGHIETSEDRYEEVMGIYEDLKNSQLTEGD
jgi:hypothetical protein